MQRAAASCSVAASMAASRLQRIKMCTHMVFGCRSACPWSACFWSACFGYVSRGVRSPVRHVVEQDRIAYTLTIGPRSFRSHDQHQPCLIISSPCASSPTPDGPHTTAVSRTPPPRGPLATASGRALGRAPRASPLHAHKRRRIVHMHRSTPRTPAAAPCAAGCPAPRTPRAQPTHARASARAPAPPRRLSS